MVVSAGRGRDRVDGRFSPGKDVNKTFRVGGEAMVKLNSLGKMFNYLRCRATKIEDGGL
jgi:hypothetical protein